MNEKHLNDSEWMQIVGKPHFPRCGLGWAAHPTQIMTRSHFNDDDDDDDDDIDDDNDADDDNDDHDEFMKAHSTQIMTRSRFKDGDGDEGDW